MGIWLSILLLLVFGLLLILAEVIFIPGTTIFGVLGFATAVVGIYLSYRQLGTTLGTAVLVGYAGVAFVALYFGFKSNVWRRFALTSRISSRVNEEERFFLQIGDRGKAISALRPSGKAEFKGGIAEVHSLGNFIDAGCTLEVVRLENNQIFVAMI
ncbi:MAG: NfeD family protein [Ferruginibacter sp.]|nr:NfeD family protein [Cytophagales bacterium]